MIGDIILIIKRFFKQLFCIHNYRCYHCGTDYNYIKCNKCGKLTDNYDLVND